MTVTNDLTTEQKILWLAELEKECPSTSCNEGHWFDNPLQPCELCKGSGTVPRFPLRRECPNRKIVRDPASGYCVSKAGVPECIPNCSRCGGERGWLPLPKEQAAGVLMRLPEFNVGLILYILGIGRVRRK